MSRIQEVIAKAMQDSWEKLEPYSRDDKLVMYILSLIGISPFEVFKYCIEEDKTLTIVTRDKILNLTIDLTGEGEKDDST